MDAQNPQAINPTEAPTSTPKTSRRPWILIAAIAAAVLVVGGTIATVVTIKLLAPERDAYAAAACQLLKDAAKEDNVFNAVIPILKAQAEAAKSEVPELRAAATKTTPASELPPDNPFYENVGDVRTKAISEWCQEHPR